MSEVKEGHQSEDMAEETTNQGRKDGNSTEKEVLYPESGCSRSTDSTKTKEEKSHLIKASVKNPSDGIHNLSTIKKQNSENSEGETPSKSREEENKDKNQGDGIRELTKNQPKSENSEGETPLKSCEEENKDDDPAQKEQHMVTAATASSSESANPDVKNGSDLTIQKKDSTENKEKNDKGCSPDRGANVKNHVDGIRESPKNEPKSDKSHTTKQEAQKTTTSATPDDKKDGQEDGTKTKLNEEIPDTNDTDAEPGDALGQAQDSTPSPQITSVRQQLDEDSNDVETIGPTTPEATEPVVPESTGGKGNLYRTLLAVGMVVVFAILVQHFIQQESPPQTNDLRQIDIFLRKLEKVKTRFTNQRAELWDRSRIHLKKHLQAAQPTEPVSLVLTAGVRAERTLSCLAHGLASAFSSALNASFLYIDGTSKASQDSDQVKLDIDRKLQGAFEGDKPVAIIHRFEELPPGSTLIFYRYCDHENAAYKKTFLIFTVLLGEEEEIPAKTSLSAVEEMVDDHLQKKFLSHGQPVSFDMMDLDKYGGLWSRISHLILPVATEKRIELGGC